MKVRTLIKFSQYVHNLTVLSLEYTPLHPLLRISESFAHYCFALHYVRSYGIPLKTSDTEVLLPFWIKYHHWQFLLWVVSRVTRHMTRLPYPLFQTPHNRWLNHINCATRHTESSRQLPFFSWLFRFVRAFHSIKQSREMMWRMPGRCIYKDYRVLKNI